MSDCAAKRNEDPISSRIRSAGRGLRAIRSGDPLPSLAGSVLPPRGERVRICVGLGVEDGDDEWCRGDRDRDKAGGDLDSNEDGGGEDGEINPRFAYKPERISCAVRCRNAR